MSNASDKNSCISHKANSRFFVVYEDFLEVAKVSPEHQYKLAAFWRVLETKTNDKVSYNDRLIEEAAKQKTPIPRVNLWIEVSYSEFVKRSLGTYKSSAFQIAAAESERLGFSKSRVLQRPRNPLDSESSLESYKEYLLNVQALQQVINGGEYPTPIEINTPLLKSIAIRKERRAIEINTPAIENNRGGAIEINTPAIENNRLKNKKNNTSKNKKNIREREQVPSTSQQSEHLGTDVPLTPSFPSSLNSNPESPESNQTVDSSSLPGFEPPTNREKEKPAKNALEVAKLALPTNEQGWDAEAIVQTLEFHRGSRYPNGAKRKSDRVRDVELEAAKTLLVDAADIWTGHSTQENAASLIRIAENLETKWWMDTNGHILPHQLVDKDRVHTAWNRIKSQASTSTNTTPIDLDAQREAARIKNVAAKELWLQKRQARQEQQAGKRAMV